MTLAGYNIRKAAQVAAFFANCEGGEIHVLKLVKLIYLADRASLKKYDVPILFDEIVSMPHGPVNSTTLNYINGLCESRDWDEFIADRQAHRIGLANKTFSIDDCDELSDAEVSVLEDIWISFGSMDRFAIRDYTHDHCPEWEDPKGASHPIPYDRILKFLGKANGALLSERIQDIRHLHSL